MKRYSFSNTVKVEWPEDDHRKMILSEDLSFTDNKGVVWTAPAGSVIDGASIPKFFWRVVGSPFIGYYRRASVIHDVYCATKSRPAQEVHDCFREMMIADGTPHKKAETMYAAVNSFGPRW